MFIILIQNYLSDDVLVSHGVSTELLSFAVRSCI